MRFEKIETDYEWFRKQVSDLTQPSYAASREEFKAFKVSVSRANDADWISFLLS